MKVAQERPQSAEQVRSVRQQLGDEWVVVMEWADGVENGGPERLIIEPLGKMPVGGLSSTVLRQIDFRAAIEEFREQTTSGINARVQRGLEKLQRQGLRTALSEGVTDEYLALLSYAYVREVSRGRERINDYLAELVGKPVSTVRGHLVRARHDGFLVGGSHGRKGGELSAAAEELVEPHALAWLAELEKLTQRGQRTAVEAAT